MIQVGYYGLKNTLGSTYLQLFYLSLFPEILSDQILEISFHNPGEKEISVRKEDKMQSIGSPITGDSYQDTDIGRQEKVDPQIGIIKLGEDLKVNSTSVKNLMCEHCGLCFRKANQLFVHTRIHTSKL